MSKASKTKFRKPPEEPVSETGMSPEQKKRELLRLVGQGGRSKRNDYGEERSTVIRQSLRLSEELHEAIRMAVEARPVRVSMHTWLLEAATEKLDRESS